MRIPHRETGNRSQWGRRVENPMRSQEKGTGIGWARKLGIRSWGRKVELGLAGQRY